MTNKTTRNFAIRLCGSEWKFCEGDCTSCDAQSISHSTDTEATKKLFTYKIAIDTDPFGKPTEEQYEESKKIKSDLASWIRMSKNRPDELLDALFKERQLEKDYHSLYEAHSELVRRYEIYKEIDTNG